MDIKGENKTILVVDDELPVRMMLCEYLTDKGFTVYQSESGEDGLERISLSKPDVVLLDLSMPGKGGLEVLAEIEQELSDMAVIIISGKGEMTDAIEALRRGAWDFITKPMPDLDVLAHALNKALERLRLMRENREYELNLERLVDQKTEDLRESAEKYRALYHESMDALCMIDTEFRFIKGNRAAVELFKARDQDRFIRHSIRDLTPIYQPDGSCTSKRLKEIIEITVKKGSHLSEWQFKRINGDYFFASMLLTAMNLKGKTLFQATIRDISVRKKTDRALLQLQKMETMGSLAGGLAHDFNNVLGGIIGLLSTMNFKLRKNLPMSKEKMGEYIDIMEKSGKRASSMVKQLLTLSRKQEAYYEPVDLNTSVRQVMTLCRNTVDKSVKLEPIYLSSPAMIKADRNQLEQALINICVNAAHAMTIMRNNGDRWGGTLKMGIDKFMADLDFCQTHPGSRPGNYWKLTVEDNGIGMSPDTINKIFDPFFSTKDSNTGTGLGLSMSYTIVNYHHGLIDVESEAGSGSTVTIYLPVLDQETVREFQQRMKRKIPRGEGVILNVDDDYLMRLAASEILKECGYNVIDASNGAEAISIFNGHAHEINGVLLDIAMPGMSGKEVYSQLKSIDPNVKVLLSSGLWQDKRIDDTLELGANSFLQKPYTLEKLGNAMLSVVNTKLN